MSVERAKIRISSTLLREPHAFDRLGGTESGLARDILLWASWKNSRMVQLNLPDFCRLLGYDRRHLLRPLTPAQYDVMLAAGWLEESLNRKKPGNLNSLIAYVITVMFTRTLPFTDRDNDSKHQHLYNKVMLRNLYMFDKKKQGTVIEFTISDEVLEQSRQLYQTIDLVDYLSLLTPGRAAKEGQPARLGVPDDAARKMYWRLSWKRHYWDYLERTGQLKKGDKPSEDNFRELLAVAGMQKLVPAKVGAYRLRKLLERVSALPSINMELNFKLSYTGNYEVTWKRNKLSEEGQAPEKPTPFPCEPAPKTWGTDPKPPVVPRRNSRTPLLTAAKAQTKATKPVQSTAVLRRAKLLEQLADAKNSVQFLEQPVVAASYADKEAGLYDKHLADARAKVIALEFEVNV